MYFVETSQLICNVSKLTGCYIMQVFVVSNQTIKLLHAFCKRLQCEMFGIFLFEDDICISVVLKSWIKPSKNA